MESKIGKEENTAGKQVAPDVLCLQTLIANLCLIGYPNPRNGEWVLVDAGLTGSAGHIIRAAEERFGPDSQLKAIILTHGHFDHIGAINGIIKRWDAPVFAHPLEIPYLTGQSSYPPPDPSVGGLMARISPLYPRKGINLGERVKPLPDDGSVPYMPGWRWIHTPGHTAGHVSLFRDKDRILIAGDAFTTVKQESAVDVLTQRKEVHGPPAYFTTDWHEAWESVRELSELKPSVVITGHGLPMEGEELGRELSELANDFDRIAVPSHGKYVDH